MQYIIVFLEGIITFVSPCLLPMLPIYVSYFMGGELEEGKRSSLHTLKNALGFVLGFTLIFVAMGAFAGTIGRFLMRYEKIVNILAGLIVILLGLNHTGLVQIGFLNRSRQMEGPEKKSGFFSALLMGMIFSVAWTPCVGAFLGSALLLASQEGSALQGTLMLLLYSLGLGIPFLASALLLDKLKGAFSFIKRHFTLINRIAGGFLILTGLAMMFGLLGRLLSLLS